MSRFINYKTLQELQKASRDGNEIARNIIDKYMGDEPDMESIDRLIEEYYGHAGIDSLPTEEEKPAEEPVPEEPVSEEPSEEPAPIEENGVPEPVSEITDTGLEAELDDLIDEEQFDDIPFSEWLKKKRRDALKAKKNADYFKAFSPEERERSLVSRKDKYAHGFDARKRQNERGFNDIASSLKRYGEIVADLPDDESPIDVGRATEAYDEFTGNETAMKAFGRSWDDADVEVIKETLASLVERFGKKNVVAVLNTLSEDNGSWRKYNDGRIDSAIASYGKSLDGLLK